MQPFLHCVTPHITTTDTCVCRVQHADVSFNLTPSKQTGGLGSAGTPGYTPSKLLLTHAERRMNMLTPSQGSKVANADLETGKVSLIAGVDMGR